MNERLKRTGISLGLSSLCLLIGYGYYSMNHHDWFNACFFTIGLLGIMLSVLRKRKS